MPHVEDKLEEIRTICRLHGCPTGRWQDVADLPARISQDSGLRSYLTEIIRSLQDGGVNLSDALDLLVLSVGGDTAPRHARELREQLSLLGGFLASVGRWPGEDGRPILTPGEVPENVHQFSRPQPRAPQPQVPPSRPIPIPNLRTQAPVQTTPAVAHQTPRTPEPTPRSDAPSPPPAAPPPDQTPYPISADAATPITEIARALARLERGNLELRAHLDSIDQRISRMEPLLEHVTPADLPATPSASPTPPPSTPIAADPPPAAIPFQREAPEAETYPEPPILIHRGSPTSNALRTLSSEDTSDVPLRASWPEPDSTASASYEVPEAEAQSLPEPIPDPTPASASDPPSSEVRRPKSTAPTPFTPRFSRFVDPDSASLPPEPVAARARSGSSSNLRPMAVPPGFLGTVPEEITATSDDSSSLSHDPPRHDRSRHFALIATVLIVLCLIGGAFMLYSRTITRTDDANGISPTPAPATAGPLTATPSATAADSPAPVNRVLDARSSLQPRQSSEVPSAKAGFHPAGTFVPSSVMDGHLISAPPPDTSQLPPSARSGVVVMEANVSPSGLVEDIHILGGNSNLRSAAIDAVRNWRYKPYLLNGIAIEVRTIIRVDMSERHPQAAQR